MFKIEITDTYGENANYSWVVRGVLLLSDAPTRRQVVTAAKRFAGWTGQPCEVHHYGGEIEIRPKGVNAVAFVYWADDHENRTEH